MLVTTWNDTISNFGKWTVGHLLQDKRDCPRDLEPSPKWKCKQGKTRDHYFLTKGGKGGGGGGWGVGKFSHANSFFVFPSSCKHFNFYFHTIYFSVYSLSKQSISQFSNPASPPPRQKNNGPSLTFFNLHTLFICKFPTISRLFFLKSLGATSSPGRFSSNKAREKRPGDEVGLGALR